MARAEGAHQVELACPTNRPPGAVLPCVLRVRRPVSLLSVFGGTTFAYNPFQLTSAQVIAQSYALDDSLDDDVVKAW